MLGHSETKCVPFFDRSAVKAYLNLLARKILGYLTYISNAVLRMMLPPKVERKRGILFVVVSCNYYILLLLIFSVYFHSIINKSHLHIDA